MTQDDRYAEEHNIKMLSGLSRIYVKTEKLHETEQKFSEKNDLTVSFQNESLCFCLVTKCDNIITSSECKTTTHDDLKSVINTFRFFNLLKAIVCDKKDFELINYERKAKEYLYGSDENELRIAAKNEFAIFMRDISAAKSRLCQLCLAFYSACFDDAACACEHIKMFETIKKIFAAETAFDSLEAFYGIFKATKRLLRSPIKHEIVEAAKKYAMSNINSFVTLKFVSKNIYVSESYLSRLFKEVTGERFSEYVNRIKVEKAKEYLLNRELNVKDVARLLGYTNANYFAATFRRVTSMSPTEYKKAAERI